MEKVNKNWDALIENNCPTCEGVLVAVVTPITKYDMLQCENFPDDCDFVISDRRAKEIINSLKNNL